MGVLKQQKEMLSGLFYSDFKCIFCEEKRHIHSHCHFQSMSFWDQRICEYLALWQRIYQT